MAKFHFLGSLELRSMWYILFCFQNLIYDSGYSIFVHLLGDQQQQQLRGISKFLQTRNLSIRSLAAGGNLSSSTGLENILIITIAAQLRLCSWEHMRLTDCVTRHETLFLNPSTSNLYSTGHLVLSTGIQEGKTFYIMIPVTALRMESCHL